MSMNNDLLPEEDGVTLGCVKDSLGIKYVGPVLEGLVTTVDASMRSTARANPLDPFDVEKETWTAGQTE